MKKQKLNSQKDRSDKLKLKAGIACLGLFLLMICTMLLTSINGIMISVAVVSHLAGMILLFLSGRFRFFQNSHVVNTNDLAYSYSKNPLDPTNPFYRSRHRLR
jgi:hypothetical protein